MPEKTGENINAKLSSDAPVYVGILNYIVFVLNNIFILHEWKNVHWWVASKQFSENLALFHAYIQPSAYLQPYAIADVCGVSVYNSLLFTS